MQFEGLDVIDAMACPSIECRPRERRKDAA